MKQIVNKLFHAPFCGAYFKDKDMSKTVEVQVIQKPINVKIDCPKCHEEHEWTYSEFCDEFGEPCDWNYNKIKCKDCGEELEFHGSDW